MPQIPNKKLNNGVAIPMIGTGAWAPSDEEAQSQVKNWLLTALNAGFRHIDTANSYGTEKATGQAVRESGIPREEIFVTTKLPSNHQHRVMESFNESFENLGLGYIDLYLIHFPQAVFYQEGDQNPKNPDGTVKTIDTVTFNDSWAELEKILKTKKVKAIGVSNFSIKTLKELLKTANIVPAVNQVELHPYLAQKELKQYCDEMGIVLTAYAPSGYSSVRSDPLILELAKKYGVSPTQVILAWHIARGIVIVPKSVDKERQKENINVSSLDNADVERINGLDRNERICNKADETGQVYGWTYEQLGW
ncbi:NADP-dependent oxidoreductase domain-containing protein [Infundibulicybe gibba]|nr:NADP-dependent oxidoreductase domain-containing protein [Infundibulicybe gibba]